MENIENISKKYLKKLDEFSVSLDNLNINENQDLTSYFQQLGNIHKFDSLFGYDGYFQSINNSLTRNGNGTEYSFSSTLKNIFSRRLYFYLAKYKEETLGNFDVKNLNLFLSKLSDSRRKDKIPFHEERKILNSLDPFNPYALAPFYETFIDSELFTTLLLLSNPNYLSYRNSLLEKLRFIVGSYVDIDLTLDVSDIYDTYIKDEANLFWGLRVLVSEYKSEFNLKQPNITGINGFERLITSLLECPYNKRQFPKQPDLIFEITPEISTIERTNLYIAINLLSIKRLKINWSDNFLELLNTKILDILNQYILSVPICENLYFQCLKYRCCCNYLDSKNKIEKDTINKSVISETSSQKQSHSINIENSPNATILIDSSGNTISNSNIVNEIDKLDNYISSMALKEFEKLDLKHNLELLKKVDPETVKKDKEYGKRVLKSLDFVNNVFMKSTEIYEKVKPIISTIASMFGIGLLN